MLFNKLIEVYIVCLNFLFVRYFNTEKKQSIVKKQGRLDGWFIRLESSD